MFSAFLEKVKKQKEAAKRANKKDVIANRCETVKEKIELEVKKLRASIDDIKILLTTALQKMTQ